MSPPLVSVCIPVAGHARFLGEALRSVLAQPIELEVLVHDDASDEDLAAVVRGAGDPRIRYLRHPRRLGVAGNRNTLLERARGELIAWLDADDAYLPGGLARQVSILMAHPAAALVHGAAWIVDEDGRRLPDWRRPFDLDTVEPARAAFAQLIQANELTTSTVVARAAAHREAGPFVAHGPSSSDWHMWLRLALLGDIAYGAEPVSRYRQHAATISAFSTADGTRLRSDVRVVRDLLRRRPGHARGARAALAARALLTATDLRARGDDAGALGCVALAGRIAPEARSVRLGVATARGDEPACHALTRDALVRLRPHVGPTRFRRVLDRAVRRDPEWDATLARVAEVVRATTPEDALVGSVTKWDPTLLALAGRRGRQVPDRRLLPGGYPADAGVAVEHVERLRREGLSHLVFPSASFWWLEHYPGLEGALGRRVHADPDCVVYDLRA